MRVFLYEFVTGGGWLEVGDALPPESLAREGRAMREALATDLASISGCQVNTLIDHRLASAYQSYTDNQIAKNSGQHRLLFDKWSATVDWTIVIAPEIGGALKRCQGWVAAANGRLLGHPPALLALACDKHSTAEHLAAAGIPVPRGHGLAAGEKLPIDFPYPAVIKPRDGAGSQDVQLVADAQSEVMGLDRPRRLERFCPGTPASVLCLCGPKGATVLPAAEQLLSDDGRFTYLGGRVPLAEPLRSRAEALAGRVIDVLPGAFGFLGIDLVLGGAADGSQDAVIEVNPRLTTSYLGLRQLTADNLAAALLAIAGGDEVRLSFADGPLQFAATGAAPIPSPSRAAFPALVSHKLKGTR